MYDGILAETTAINGHGGDLIEAYSARPLGPGPFGSVVVIHHLPGYDAATKEIVRRFAVLGYVAKNREATDDLLRCCVVPWQVMDHHYRSEGTRSERASGVGLDQVATVAVDSGGLGQNPVVHRRSSSLRARLVGPPARNHVTSTCTKP